MGSYSNLNPSLSFRYKRKPKKILKLLWRRGCPLSLLSDLLSKIPLFAILLIIRMSFSIFPKMIDLRKGENRKLGYKLFKPWQRKAIPKVKKSSVKWKYEKEIATIQLQGTQKQCMKNKLTFFASSFPATSKSRKSPKEALKK